MATIEVKTQAALDKALKSVKPGDIIACIGDGWFVAWGSSHVVARESSHVVAWGSSHVEARESSHVVARESSHVVARESSHVVASKLVAVHIQRQYGNPTVTGGVQIDVPPIETPEQFCDLYGIPVVDGLVTLYKAIDDDYSTAYARAVGITYRPGDTPEAPDWSTKPVCGGGLHLSPRPAMAASYHGSAARYVACPVAIADLIVVEPGYGADKVKAPRIVGPIVEVDIDGEPV